MTETAASAAPPESRTAARRRRPIRERLLPGDRRVWLTAALVAAVGLLTIAVELVLPRDYYTGTNSVRTRSFAIELARGDQLCVPGLQVPAGTARVQVEVDTDGGPLPALSGFVDAGGRRYGTTRIPASPQPGRRKVAFALPERPSAPESSPGTLCVRSQGKVFFGGMAALQGNDVSPTVDGRPSANRVAIWYLPPSGEQRSLLSQLPTIFDRAALFRPGVVGPWTYWVLIFLWMPLVAYAALRLLATAGDRPMRRTAVAVAAIAFANAAAWALITPAFEAPDESEHFAYVQWFAETGKRVSSTPTIAPTVYSRQEVLALDAVRLFSHTEQADGRPPWLKLDERRLAERTAAEPRPPPQDNGGGNTPATQSHSPLYYGSLAPGYLATQGSSTWSQLTAARLLSALYGAIVVLCAFAVVRELVPRQPLAAVAAGLLVAFEPMFGFISGAINNDNGVNALAAVVIYLTVRALRRGLTPRIGLALGAALVGLPLMKATGYALYPVVGLALAGMLWRRHERADLRAYAALAATFVLSWVAWKVIAPAFEQARAPGAPPDTGATATGIPARNDIRGYFSYLWQVFLPPLPFMTDLFTPRSPFFDIYVIRGFGAFGWYAVLFPEWVYRIILAVIGVVGVGGVLALRRYRDWARRHWMELAFVALVPFVVLAAVEAAYYSPVARDLTAEFGRYEFPAITALAALAVGGCFALGRRRAALLATGLVTAMIVLGYASQLLTLAGFYT